MFDEPLLSSSEHETSFSFGDGVMVADFSAHTRDSKCAVYVYFRFFIRFCIESTNRIEIPDSPGMQTLVMASPGHVVSAGHTLALAPLQYSGELNILGLQHARFVIAGYTESHGVIS